MADIIELTRNRFDLLPVENWTDDQCREADYYTQVSVTIRAMRYERDRLLVALQRLADATESKDPEAIRKGLLWARHYLKLFKQK